MSKLKLSLSFVLLAFMPLCALADLVTLAWDPVPDARVAGYELHWGTESGGYSAMDDIPGQTSDTRTISIDAPGHYYAALRARNVDGSLVSGFSNEVEFNIAEPIPAPENLHKKIQVTVTIAP